MNTEQYIIRTDKPFSGIADSFLCEDGTVACSNYGTPDNKRISFEDYKEREDGEYKLVSSKELDEMVKKYLDTLVTEPESITDDQYDWYLGCLPPVGYTSIAGVTIFHMSERIQNSLVLWCAKIGDNYYSCKDHSYKSLRDIAKKFGDYHIAYKEKE